MPILRFPFCNVGVDLRERPIRRRWAGGASRGGPVVLRLRAWLYCSVSAVTFSVARPGGIGVVSDGRRLAARIGLTRSRSVLPYEAKGSERWRRCATVLWVAVS